MCPPPPAGTLAAMTSQSLPPTRRRHEMNVIETIGLGKRYGRTWALRECTVAIPAGHVAALAGPNGAGKTTLLNLAVGLGAPSAGGVPVRGAGQPGRPAALDGIGLVAQDTPLYKNLSAADMLHLTRNLSRRFDQPYAQDRLGELGIPLKRKTGRLSGGQRAQLALTLALALRPRLLVLDEPVAMLDPVARHDFMATVLTAAAADGVSVVLSSHVLADLERVAGYLILLSPGRRPLPWRRMAWVTWRQHRVALAGVAALLGAWAVYLWIAGLQAHHAYAAVTGCQPTSSPACADMLNNFTLTVGDFNFAYGDKALAASVMPQTVPALVGAFLRAPVLALELETGTFRCTWTLGFGRWRWAVAKLVPLAVTVAAAAGVTSLVFSWYAQPFFSDRATSPFTPKLFDLRGGTFSARTPSAPATAPLPR